MPLHFFKSMHTIVFCRLVRVIVYSQAHPQICKKRAQKSLALSAKDLIVYSFVAKRNLFTLSWRNEPTRPTLSGGILSHNHSVTHKHKQTRTCTHKHTHTHTHKLYVPSYMHIHAHTDTHKNTHTHTHTHANTHTHTHTYPTEKKLHTYVHMHTHTHKKCSMMYSSRAKGAPKYDIRGLFSLFLRNEPCITDDQDLQNKTYLMKGRFDQYSQCNNHIQTLV